MQIVDKIVMKPIGEVKPYEKNPRRNSKTVDLLCKAIPIVGFNVPLVIDKDGVIVKGHARYLAALRLGMTEVPCVVSEADPESIKADRIADNKVFEFSKWLDEELLHEVDMLDLGFDLSEFGLPTMKMDAPWMHQILILIMMQKMTKMKEKMTKKDGAGLRSLWRDRHRKHRPYRL